MAPKHYFRIWILNEIMAIAHLSYSNQFPDMHCCIHHSLLGMFVLLDSYLILISALKSTLK